MGVYRKFERNDVTHSVIYASPRVRLTSGSGGWRTFEGGEGSVSLYSGVRGRKDVRSVDYSTSGISVYPLDKFDTQSIDGVLFVSGSYPSTGSVEIVKVRKSSGIADGRNWYDRHFSAIEGLYSHYSKTNPSYFTGSYANYCLFFSGLGQLDDPNVHFPSCLMEEVTSDFTVELILKPLAQNGSVQGLITQPGRFTLFYLPEDDSGGKLNLIIKNQDLSLDGQGSFGGRLDAGRWNHLAVTFSSGTVQFFLNGQRSEDAVTTGHVESLRTGSEFGVRIGCHAEDNGDPTDGFNGFVAETRFWNRRLSDKELGEICSTREVDPLSYGLIHYAKFDDGPLSVSHGLSMGSGTLNRTVSSGVGYLESFDSMLPRSPIWQVMDSTKFTVRKRFAEGTPQIFKALHIPSMYYGRQITTGSLRITCRAYAGKGITRTLVDDGRGSLYLSGSTTQKFESEKELNLPWDSAGMWQKVGNVFYSEGIVVITDPSLLDLGETDKDPDIQAVPPLSVEFRGDNRIPTKTFVCRLGSSEANGSNNQTYSYRETYGDEDASNDRLVLNGDRETWITAVGIYDDERRLVAVAKLASPIRKREKDKLAIRLRMDF